MSDSTEEARRVREAYVRLFKSPNGKIVLTDLKRIYMEGKICDLKNGTDAVVAKAACHDLVQMLINQSQPIPEQTDE